MRISDWSSDVCSSDLKHYGVEYRFVERSPLNTYLLEQSGMFQQSGTCEDVISGLLRDIATGCGPTRSADRLLSTILGKIGRASCRERVCQYVSISVVDVSLKKQKIGNRRS